jgi:hypothetical protein
LVLDKLKDHCYHSPVEINMSKFNAGKASVLALTAVAVLASFLLGKSLTSVRAYDNEVNDNGWSSCISTGPQCGTGNGHKTKTETQDASHTDVCPTDYSDAGHNDSWDNQCRKSVTTEGWGNWQDGPKGSSGVQEERTHTEVRTCSDWKHGNAPNAHCDENSDWGGWSDGVKTLVNQEERTVYEHRHWIVSNTYDYKAKDRVYDACPTDWSAKSGDETKCEKVETKDCQTGEIDNSACHNIDGVQTSIPEGMHMDAEGANCVNFSGSGPAPRNDEGVGGAVLGASTGGQVLGANTMAGTGSFAEIFYQAIMGIGATISAFGIKGLKKGKKAI